AFPLTLQVFKGPALVRTETLTQDIITPQAVPAHIAEQVEVRDGSHAIEVSALFEDAVVEVRHLSDPSAGRISGATKGLLGSAAAALLSLLVLFVVSYVQVAHLRQRQ